ncbi:hypothetical protein NAMH_0285 [Nautilia profundicola AmH]|uniref:Uncharacterized protein n=1 Tax=Nautilia profundicola (strain ATCC BAA-1463 / DSM 18972 / AmH) TaxID=598659 RepID=B9L7V1_NAUPA|nr:hypothetical protein [Nautilia profundicola]ACM93210.1 hypothetical protein NAMH_0285 [Nautilia profundicola AmH]
MKLKLSIILAALVSVVGIAKADMAVDFLTLDATEGAVDYGTGYDTHRKMYTGKCVEIVKMDTYNGGIGPQQDWNYGWTKTTSEITKNANISAELSIKALSGATKTNMNNKTTLLQKTESSSYAITLYAYSYFYDAPKFVKIEYVKLTPQAKQLLKQNKVSEFRQRCGDGFVIGIQEGREFIGTASVQNQTFKQSMEFASKTGLGIKSVNYDVDANVDIKKAAISTFGVNNFKVHTYSTGTNMRLPKSVDEFEDFATNFYNADSATYKKRVKYIVAPYSMLADYPFNDILQGDTKETYMTYFVNTLWDLKAAMKDADFIINPKTQKYFALGTTNKIRRNRVNAIKRYKNAWLKEFNDLLKAAQQCNKDFTNRCEQLAIYYRDRRNILNMEDRVMPERYVQDCYTPIILDNLGSYDGKISTALKTASASGFEVIAGDTETAGNPMRVVAALKFKADKNRLKAILKIAKIEWKRSQYKGMPLTVRTKKGESGFGLSLDLTLFDLAHPQKYMDESRPLDTCSFNRVNPIKSAMYREPKPDSGFDRVGFKGEPVQGLIDYRVAHKNSRGQQTIRNGKGVLEYIKCELDRKGKHDERATCSEVGVKDIELNLISKQDLAANRWRDPKLAYEPRILTNFLNGKPLSYNGRRETPKNKYKVPTSQFKYIKVKLSPVKTQKQPNMQKVPSFTPVFR